VRRIASVMVLVAAGSASAQDVEVPVPVSGPVQLEAFSDDAVRPDRICFVVDGKIVGCDSSLVAEGGKWVATFPYEFVPGEVYRFTAFAERASIRAASTNAGTVNLLPPAPPTIRLRPGESVTIEAVPIR
jgi:hypothetical protein